MGDVTCNTLLYGDFRKLLVSHIFATFLRTHTERLIWMEQSWLFECYYSSPIKKNGIICISEKITFHYNSEWKVAPSIPLNVCEGYSSIESQLLNLILTATHERVMTKSYFNCESCSTKLTSPSLTFWFRYIACSVIQTWS